jgi:hypothetical protein
MLEQPNVWTIFPSIRPSIFFPSHFGARMNQKNHFDGGTTTTSTTTSTTTATTTTTTMDSDL